MPMAQDLPVRHPQGGVGRVLQPRGWGPLPMTHALPMGHARGPKGRLLHPRGHGPLPMGQGVVWPGLHLVGVVAWHLVHHCVQRRSTVGHASVHHLQSKDVGWSLCS